MIAILHINADKIQLRDNHRIRPGVSEHFHQARQHAFRRVDSAKVAICVIPALVTDTLPVRPRPRPRLRYAPDPVWRLLKRCCGKGDHAVPAKLRARLPRCRWAPLRGRVVQATHHPVEGSGPESRPALPPALSALQKSRGTIGQAEAFNHDRGRLRVLSTRPRTARVSLTPPIWATNVAPRMARNPSARTAVSRRRESLKKRNSPS